MGFHRSDLKYLSVLGLLLLGGCGWIADLKDPNGTETHANRVGEPKSELSQSDADQANTSQTDGDPTGVVAIADPTNTDIKHETATGAAAVNHGARLSTLDDGLSPRQLPEGRLPPHIVPATGDAQRLHVIQPGRSDPFSSLPVQPFLVQQSPGVSNSGPAVPVDATNTTTVTPPSVPNGQPLNSQPATVPPAPQAVVPVPITSQLPTPLQRQPQQSQPAAAVPTVPISATSSTVPTSPIASDANGVSPLSAAASFEFSGVVQMGDRVNIIVEEPSGSRYVQIGERVGNGQFLIKSVDFNQGGTPAVILDRGGTESVHWVGNPIAM